MSDPFANLTLVHKNEGHCIRNDEKPRQPDVPHRKLRVFPLPPVRLARTGPSDTIDQIIEKAHRIVELELDLKHKKYFSKIRENTKMRIAALSVFAFANV